MKILLNIAYNSLLSRKVTVFLTIISITISLTLFLSIEKLRLGAKQSFFGSISSSDLILGAKSGKIQLLLYSMFQIGSPTNNISWETYKDISDKDDIDWIVPISLGDSHKQFRVMGTTDEYFKNFKYKKNKSLVFKDGNSFNNLLDVVIGSDVARALNYNIKDKIIIAHGIASNSFHDEFPFQISGILKKTGTSVDRLVIVSLDALEAIHVDWKSGRNIKSSINKDISSNSLVPKEITAAIIKIKSPIKLFQFQREVNRYNKEPIQVIIPGIVLNQLWNIISVTENIMRIISLMVIITALIGMVAILYSTLNERIKEMSLLRIVGGSPQVIFTLLILESFFISCISVVCSILLLNIFMLGFYPILDNMFGIFIEYTFLTIENVIMLICVIFISCFVSLFPSLKVFKSSIYNDI